MILELKRVETDNEGTTGVLYTTGFACFSLELPWRNNIPYKSHIPEGLYLAQWDEQKMGGLHTIRLYDVPGRTGILIHVGNIAGDVDLLYKSDVAGCIVVGYSKDELSGQKAVLNSKEAMQELLATIRDADSLMVEIENIYT